MHNTLLLIGNGLVRDFRALRPVIVDSSRPLQSEFMVRANGQVFVRQSINDAVSCDIWPTIDPDHGKSVDLCAELHFLIRYIVAKSSNLTDFDIIQKIIEMDVNSPDLNLILEEMRYGPDDYEFFCRAPTLKNVVLSQIRSLLTHYYSEISLQFICSLKSDWVWYRWFLACIKEIRCIVSFNYDLIVEILLSEFCNFNYVIHSDWSSGVAPFVFKPHGSVNYVFGNDISISFKNPPHKRKFHAAFHQIDVPLSIIPVEQLRERRLEPDIVLPTEASRIRDFQNHIDPGYKFIKHEASNATRCLIIGLSYWDCDRPEINEILGALSSRVEVVVCNPYPSSDLLDFLSFRFPNLTVHSSAPP